MSSLAIRRARPDDAAAMLEIYAPIVLESSASFEEVVPSIDDFRQRVVHSLEKWTWLVAEENGEIAGYAYGGSHRARVAYRWSVETSVYVRDNHRGKGLGVKLYEELLGDLTAMGYCNAYAGITLPNDASVATHEKVGFRLIGVFPLIGHKYGRWHDVGWWHRKLRDEPPESISPAPRR